MCRKGDTEECASKARMMKMFSTGFQATEYRNLVWPHRFQCMCMEACVGFSWDDVVVVVGRGGTVVSRLDKNHPEATYTPMSRDVWGRGLGAQERQLPFTAPQGPTLAYCVNRSDLPCPYYAGPCLSCAPLNLAHSLVHPPQNPAKMPPPSSPPLPSEHRATVAWG